MKINFNSFNTYYKVPKQKNLSFKSNDSFRGTFDISVSPSCTSNFVFITEFDNKEGPLKKGQFTTRTGQIFNRHTTEYFRNDILWYGFANYIAQRFSDFEKINVYDYGCSDGSEAYSLSMLLQTCNPNPEKFYPIKAKDNSENVIDKCIEKKEEVSDKFYPVLLNFFPSKVKNKMNDKNFRTDFTRKVSDSVEFSCANILEDIENIDSKNPSIVMCRNMWPYIREREYEEFTKNLYDKLAPGSIVVLGDFDQQCSIKKALINSGFVSCCVSYSDSRKSLNYILEKN